MSHCGKKLIVFCGGTGGHFYPGLSVARQFLKNGGSAKLILSGKHSLKQAEIAEKFKIPAFILPSMPVPLGIIGKIKFIAAFFLHIMKHKKILKTENPDFVLGMGSFNTVPSGIAARMLKIPLFIHDGNSYFGRANVFLSRFALHAGIAFPPVNPESLKSSFTVTGMPLRPEIYPEYCVEKFGNTPVHTLNEIFGTSFSNKLPLVLVVGGSQGAKTFNLILPKLFKALHRNDFQVLHLCGPNRKFETEKSYENAVFKYHILESSEEMGLLYTASSLVVSRSGGSTIAELALYGKSALLIPFPYASEDHQTRNAEFYITKGASSLIPEKQCESLFKNKFQQWLEKKNMMTENAKKVVALAKPDATEDLIAIMEKFCENYKR